MVMLRFDQSLDEIGRGRAYANVICMTPGEMKGLVHAVPVFRIEGASALRF